MERMLVGVDGSPASLDALGWAADVATRADLDLTAARVFEPTQAELPPEEETTLHEDQRRELDEWCAQLAEGLTRPESVLLDGPEAQALLDAAGERNVDLLVVGSRGAGGFLHLHVGSVAHHLTHHTTLPLAIVPSSGSHPIRHLVVGVDGSPPSLAAVGLSADLAEALEVPVTVVHAYEAVVEWVPETDPRSWHRVAEDEVRRWAIPIEKTGVPLEIDVERDLHPVDAVGRAVESRPGSVAVVGTRGVGGFTGLRLGRVPLQLVHGTGAAVILVPPRP